MDKAVRDVLIEVGAACGRSAEDCEPFIDILKSNWYDDLDSLATLTQEDLQALGIPMRITKELAKAGHLLPEEGAVAAEAPRGGGGRDRERDDRSHRNGRDKGKGKGKGKDQDERGGKGKQDRHDRGGGKGKDSKGKGGGKSKGKFEQVIEVKGDTLDDFDWTRKILGENLANVRHIESQTRVRVWLTGRPKNDDGRLRLILSGETQDDVNLAAENCRDLLEAVYDEHDEWEGSRGGGGGDRGRGYDKGKGKKRKGDFKGKGDSKGKNKGKGKGKGDGDRWHRPERRFNVWGGKKEDNYRDSWGDDPAEKRRRT